MLLTTRSMRLELMIGLDPHVLFADLAFFFIRPAQGRQKCKAQSLPGHVPDLDAGVARGRLQISARPAVEMEDFAGPVDDHTGRRVMLTSSSFAIAWSIFCGGFSNPFSDSGSSGSFKPSGRGELDLRMDQMVLFAIDAVRACSPLRKDPDSGRRPSEVPRNRMPPSRRA